MSAHAAEGRIYGTPFLSSQQSCSKSGGLSLHSPPPWEERLSSTFPSGNGAPTFEVGLPRLTVKNETSLDLCLEIEPAGSLM